MDITKEKLINDLGITTCPKCKSNNLMLNVCSFDGLQEKVKINYKKNDFPREIVYCVDCDHEWFIQKMVLFFECYLKEHSNLPIKNRIIRRDLYKGD